MVGIARETNRKPSRLDIDQLTAPIRTGRFVPFLGAAASGLRPADGTWTDDGSPESPVEKGWQTVRRRYEALSRALENDNERRYLKTIAERHGLDPDDDREVSSEASATLPFQLAVTRLGLLVAAELAARIADGSHVAADAIGSRVEVRTATEPTMLDRLFEAIQALGKIPDPVGRRPPALAHHEVILTRLFTLGCVMMGRDAVLERIKQTLSGDEQRRAQSKVTSYAELYHGRDPGFGIEQLHWLDGLVWYLLRVDIPIYPTTTELSFELTLLPPEPKIPSLDLQESGELLPYDVLVANVREIFAEIASHYEPRTVAPLPVHRSVARALRFMYDRKRGSGENPNPSRTITLALTTNYDKELERALVREGTNFHVVYPITIYPRPKSPLQKQSDAEIRDRVFWVMKTCYHDQPEGSQYVLLSKDDNPLRGVKIVGPIVVKLHGSPLDQDKLPDPITWTDGSTEKRKTGEPWTHFVVLSESSFLDSAIDEKLPTWIEKNVRSEDQDLWFLGYSIVDWNVRLRLYRYEARSREERTEPSKKVAFAHRFEPHKTQLLSTIGVDFCEHDGGLMRFAELLDEAVEQEAKR